MLYNTTTISKKFVNKTTESSIFWRLFMKFVMIFLCFLNLLYLLYVITYTYLFNLSYFLIVFSVCQVFNLLVKIIELIF